MEEMTFLLYPKEKNWSDPVGTLFHPWTAINSKSSEKAKPMMISSPTNNNPPNPAQSPDKIVGELIHSKRTKRFVRRSRCQSCF